MGIGSPQAAVFDTAEEAVAGADVIVVATSSPSEPGRAGRVKGVHGLVHEGAARRDDCGSPCFGAQRLCSRAPGSSRGCTSTLLAPAAPTGARCVPPPLARVHGPLVRMWLDPPPFGSRWTTI